MEAEGLRVGGVERTVLDAAALPALRGGLAVLLRADGEADEGVGAADEGDVVEGPVEAGEVLRADEEHLNDPGAAALELVHILRFLFLGVLGCGGAGLLGVFLVDAALAYGFRAAGKVAAAGAEAREAEDAAAAEDARA